MTGVLAVDLGKTFCRAALWTGAGRLDAEGPGAAGLAALNGAVAAERAILPVAWKLLQQAGLAGVAAVAIGAAGALSAPAAGQELAERLLVALPARRLAITSDAVISACRRPRGTARGGARCRYRRGRHRRRSRWRLHAG